MTYGIKNGYKNHKPVYVLLLLLLIVVLTVFLKNNVFADEFKLQRRDIHNLKEEITDSVSDNKIEKEVCFANEKIDDIDWYIDDNILYIRKTCEGKTRIRFENFYECPWNQYDYKTVNVQGGIGVKLWYFNKGKARKCGKI